VSYWEWAKLIASSMVMSMVITAVAGTGRTKSLSGSLDFDTSEKREGKGGAADEAPIYCLPLVAEIAVVRALLFRLHFLSELKKSLSHGASTGYPWTSISSRCVSRYPPTIFYRACRQSVASQVLLLALISAKNDFKTLACEPLLS
jgi:hypothetical protein